MNKTIEGIFTAISRAQSAADVNSIKQAITGIGVHVNELRWNGSSILKAAVAANCHELIRFLIEQGAILNACDEDAGTTPLGIACRVSTLDTVKLLIELGAEVNLPPKTGSSPPICRSAGMKAKLPTLRYLIERGADVNLCSINLEGQPSGNALTLASAMGNRDAVKLLLEHQADPNVVFPSGTALSKAVEEGHSKIVKLLLDHRADTNLVAVECAGFPLAHKTPLEIALLKKRSAIAKLLSD